jgi:hypothetical protein
MWLKTFKYTCHDESFFFCLKICTNVKSKYEKGIFDHFFYEKKVIKFAKDWKSCCDISLLVLVWQQF